MIHFADDKMENWRHWGISKATDKISSEAGIGIKTPQIQADRSVFLYSSYILFNQGGYVLNLLGLTTMFFHSDVYELLHKMAIPLPIVALSCTSFRGNRLSNVNIPCEGRGTAAAVDE